MDEWAGRTGMDGCAGWMKPRSPRRGRLTLPPPTCRTYRLQASTDSFLHALRCVATTRSRAASGVHGVGGQHTVELGNHATARLPLPLSLVGLGVVQQVLAPPGGIDGVQGDPDHLTRDGARSWVRTWRVSTGPCRDGSDGDCSPGVRTSPVSIAAVRLSALVSACELSASDGSDPTPAVCISRSHSDTHSPSAVTRRGICQL